MPAEPALPGYRDTGIPVEFATGKNAGPEKKVRNCRQSRLYRDTGIPAESATGKIPVLRKRIVIAGSAGLTGIPEYRDTGIPEYRNTGIPEYRNTGIPEYRNTG